MQLILNTETTVEIKTKMSINEENIEKCVSNILSAVENGILPNGDISNGNEEAGDTNKNEKHKETKETEKINTCGDLEQGLNDVVSINAHNELSPKNNDQTDTISKNVLDTNEEESVGLPNNVQQCEIQSEVMAEPVTSTTEWTESCKIATDTELNNETIESTADLSEKVAIEKEHPDHDISETSDLNDDLENNMDVNKCLTVEKEHAEPTSIEMDTTDISSSADVNKCVAAENEHNGIDNMAIVTDVDGVMSTANASITLTSKKEHAEPCIQTEFTDSNCTVDTAAQKNITVENHNETSVNIRTELNDISSTLDKSVKCEEENIASNNSELNNDCLVTDIDKTQASSNGVEKIIMEKKLNVEEKNMEEKKQIIDLQKTGEAQNHEDTIEYKSVSEVVCRMEMTEKDMSVDTTDSVNKLDNNGSENVNSLEKEVKSDGKEEKADDDEITPKKMDLMDIDETPETEVKEKANTNLETPSVKSPSNLSGTPEHVTVSCNAIEPVTENKMETVDMIPGSLDDIIFNLDDDDKEQTTKMDEIKESESNEITVDDNKTIDCENDTIKMPENIDKTSTEADKPSEVIIDLDETISKGIITGSKAPSEKTKEQQELKTDEVTVAPVLKLSNTLNILSDDEEDPEPKATNVDNKCINIEDDDDIMLIDDDTSVTENKAEPPGPTKETESEKQVESKPQSPLQSMEVSEEIEKTASEPVAKEDTPVLEKENTETTPAPEISDKVEETKTESDLKKTLLQEKFLKTCKKNLSDMTREDLEEFCILKIVESILDRSNLSEIRTKLKTMAQNIEDYKKKAMMLTKQNRDLQVVLKSIQEDQKKGTESIVPLKITRSVGMQVLMADKSMPRRKAVGLPPINKATTRSPVSPSPRPQKPTTPQIPVPRLVPANNPTLKSPNTQPVNAGKITSPVPNGIRTLSPVQKGEKRTHNRIQSVTVDLTDDEPPAKVVNRAAGPVVPPVRLVPSQNLLAPPRPTTVNSPRKVYIPISGPQGQNVRPGQTIMLKTVPPQGPRQRCPPPHMVRMPQTMRMTRPQGMRHPAPLPDCVKQYQPPNWKALPPAPDLKLAKVENGIVISWKIEGYQEDSYEEIASYQLYAYQETSSPPSTALWKKIGDVKALPLPMACTLTQFMAGYKYYFAVRALDIRSRLGPFSLPGSILLLNKM